MSNEELVILMQRNGDPEGKLMLQLISQTEKYAMKLSQPFIMSGVVEDDEVKYSINFLANSRAVHYWKPAGGAVYSQTLRFCLLSELINASNENGNIRLPKNILQSVYQMRKARHSFIQQYGRRPTDAELCKILGVKLEELHLWKTANRIQHAMRLDAPISEDDENAATLVQHFISHNA